jgi:rare lipoprotein A
MSKFSKNSIILLLAFLLSSCIANIFSDGPPRILKNISTKNAVPRSEPLSQYGNGDEKGYYEVRGKRYKVMSSAKKYQAKGIASWYGTKFHGRYTSNREIYNIYAMTAAHKTLPLPSYVEVRNLTNNKTIIVRVNDRGPFIDDRLIDLSYAAALKLDIVKNGTAQVEIRTVTEKNDDLDKNIDEEAYIQIGAFEKKENAYDYLALLKDNKFNSANVRKEYNWLKPLSPTYKVQIGPIKNKKQHNELLSRLRKIGVYQTKIVTN